VLLTGFAPEEASDAYRMARAVIHLVRLALVT
jgi:hypothetical protein